MGGEVRVCERHAGSEGENERKRGQRQCMCESKNSCVCVFLCVQIIVRAVGALIEIGICRLSDDYHYPQIPSVMSLGK